MPNLLVKGLDARLIFENSGLKIIDKLFLEESNLLEEITNMRAIGSEPKSEFLIRCAPLLEDFIARLFYIEDQRDQQFAIINSHQPIMAFKKLFVIKYARRLLANLDSLPTWDELESWRQSVVPAVKDQEWATANYAMTITEEQNKSKMLAWCARALNDRPKIIENWVSFKLPEKTDYASLLELQKNKDGTLMAKKLHPRQGFDCTSKIMDSRNVQDQANYCIVCHPKQGDFCRIGFPIKKGEPGYKINDLGNLLVGCPLEQHISEMNALMQTGYPIAALAVAMVNNPMLAATGNRICHDCMSSCIYQKQTPVDIPNIESAILDLVLNLPWGVEIYYLLTRWNPLRSKQWLPKDYNGHKIAIMGMGPAGFTMAHHLLMEGFAVVGLDGQAMSSMPTSWHEPVYNYQDIKSNLLNRASKGFGGVAEYGITARWDKNLLSILRLVLERRSHFQCFSSVRFGGNWSFSDAWRQGFSHVVLAVGAGLPNVPNIPGSLAPGMRTANDFLMALHLGNVNFSNLEVKLPALVIGGGLTAVDTATELQAFYLLLIEKVANTLLEQPKLKQELESSLSDSDWKQVQIWLEHGLMLQAEKRNSLNANRAPKIIELLHKWGGVKIVYRRAITNSPAYRENHLELARALSEGVLFVEDLHPKEILLDQNGSVSGVKFNNSMAEETVFPAKSVWTAIGTKLNVAYSFEHAGEMSKSSSFCYDSFKWSLSNGLEKDHLLHCKDRLQDRSLPIFTSVKVNAGVSFVGDTNPAFHGSVVKAMASAKRSYEAITDRVTSIEPNSEPYAVFASKIVKDFTTEVVAVDGSVITFNAPQIARNWRPGMFCRLFVNEPKVLIPIKASQQEITVYDKNLSGLSVGQRVELMGPSGVRYNIDEPDIWRLWFVDDSGLAFILSLLPYLNKERVFLVMHSELEAPVLDMLRGFRWVNALEAWSSSPCDHIYAEMLLNYIKCDLVDEVAFFTSPVVTMELEPLLSIIPMADKARVMVQAMGPMQCALKGVCAQCLQWQIDPKTKKRTKAVYSCSWQHQPFQILDLKHVSDRQRVNSLLRKILCL